MKIGLFGLVVSFGWFGYGWICELGKSIMTLPLSYGLDFPFSFFLLIQAQKPYFL
jgi:hypothetical protein